MDPPAPGGDHLSRGGPERARVGREEGGGDDRLSARSGQGAAAGPVAPGGGRGPRRQSAPEGRDSGGDALVCRAVERLVPSGVLRVWLDAPRLSHHGADRGPDRFVQPPQGGGQDGPAEERGVRTLTDDDGEVARVGVKLEEEGGAAGSSRHEEGRRCAPCRRGHRLDGRPRPHADRLEQGSPDVTAAVPQGESEQRTPRVRVGHRRAGALKRLESEHALRSHRQRRRLRIQLSEGRRALPAFAAPPGG